MSEDSLANARKTARFLGFLAMTQLTHFDANGQSRMVDVGDKPVTARTARASGLVQMRLETLAVIRSGQGAKGNVLEVARLAGIMAAKRTDELIPLCHSLPLDGVEVDFAFPNSATVGAATLAISATARVSGRTGVEMEALVAVTTAALTVYDMCKAIDREMVIAQVRLEEKTGGRSGHFRR